MKKLLILFTALCVLLSCGSQNETKVKILAHRGLCTTGVNFTTDENTLEALRRAQEEGVDGVEFDVHLTADDSLVIRHDNRIEEGLSCQGSNYEDIRAYVLPHGNRIPTLGEWLDQAKK
ncbi:MAG: glycerophosphodiester phosphodiesterase family protein, partial [Candidatus Cryptobacteroides sp.]|nr:glycerophosphodiester phosphodiesterase family protein [Bacteroidales bacterium]MDY5743184.1 glycerophosphodiester phosphodiesterase family protein [Candidatus Cryptobacteroides sp.]